MPYYLERMTNTFNLDDLILAQNAFFFEGVYRNCTWDEENARARAKMMIEADDFEVVAAYDEDHQIAGFFEWGYESPGMKEEVAMFVNFYIMPVHRRGQCSQLLLEFGTKLCQDRGAKLFWASSTAGFSDNGANERAFRMLLKRNQFDHVGSFLVREFSNEQSQKSIQGGQEGRQ